MCDQVRESTALPDELNVLYFSIHTNVPLKAGASTVTITGIHCYLKLTEVPLLP